ncbi:glycosyltransferase [Aeromonas caviae]|uniref:glycosyltransferase n=1 Tax=Aeromonas caviae TaxID=648 RepID=UPI0037550654
MVEGSYKIAILLSTYNGGNYLREQIDSLIKQDFDGQIDIHIRDDGSKDDTINIINEYSLCYRNKFFLHKGDNLGPALSFLTLVEKVQGYDFYALCDQDDYWFVNKISVACEYLKKNVEMPALYSSALNVVDKNLNFITKSHIYECLDFNNILVESAVAGCTMVFNENLRKEIVATLPVVRKHRIMMHDAWILKIALIKGTAYFDSNSFIKYRQHDSNVVGASTNLIVKLKKRRNNILCSKNEHSIVDEALMLYSIYHNDDKVNDRVKYSLLEVISFNSSFLKRLRIVMSLSVYRRRVLDNAIFLTSIVFNIYRRHIDLTVNT